MKKENLYLFIFIYRFILGTDNLQACIPSVCRIPHGSVDARCRTGPGNLLSGCIQRLYATVEACQKRIYCTGSVRAMYIYDCVSRACN